MGVSNSDLSSHQSVSVSDQSNQVLVGDAATKHANGTAVQKVIESVGKTAGQVIESGGDIITAPAVWLKSIQQNWLAYMIVIAIILSILTFFYRTVCFHLNCKKNNSFNSSFIELAKVIGNKHGTLQQQLPSSMNSLRSVLSNTPTELTV